MTKKSIVFTVMLVLLMLVFIEFSVRIFTAVIGPRDPRLSFASFKGKEWAVDLLKESEDMVYYTFFDPYTMWSVKNHKGKYVNSDAEGRRLTWNPPMSSSGKVVNVYTFGGSTMFGAGSRDDYTIASDLSKSMNLKSAKYYISNYGQPAYRFNQEVLKLILLIKDGKKPDWAIFYDGVNDVTISYEAGQAYSIGEENAIRNKLQGSNLDYFTMGARGILGNICESCKITFHFIKDFRSNISGKAVWPRPVVGQSYSEEKRESLANDISRDYQTTLDLLDKLSKAYGFKYVVFWQPSLLDGKGFIGDEKALEKIDFAMQDSNLLDLYRRVHGKISQIKNPNFFDISQVLDKRQNQIYYDKVHVSEEGNEIISQAIFKILNEKYGL